MVLLQTNLRISAGELCTDDLFRKERPSSSSGPKGRLAPLQAGRFAGPFHLAAQCLPGQLPALFGDKSASPTAWPASDLQPATRPGESFAELALANIARTPRTILPTGPPC